MPLYEYKCKSCGHRFEILQKLDEPPLERCEVCGGKLEKLFHPVTLYSKHRMSLPEIRRQTAELEKKLPKKMRQNF